MSLAMQQPFNTFYETGTASQVGGCKPAFCDVVDVVYFSYNNPSQYSENYGNKLSTMSVGLCWIVGRRI